MPPRRSHKKSRAGCRRCKNRKIKCDEVHPRCGNCLKHGVVCDYEQPVIGEDLAPAEALQSPPEAFNQPMPGSPALPRGAHGASSSSGFQNSQSNPPHHHSTLATPSFNKAAASAAALGNGGSNNSSSSSGGISLPQKDRMMEMKLMYQYFSSTSMTLLADSPSTEDIWRRVVPEMAFAGPGRSYLANAMLCVAALHLRSQAPGDKALVRASHAYTAAMLSEYLASLNNGIDADNAEALFLTSVFIAFQATASRIFLRDDAIGDAESGGNVDGGERKTRDGARQDTTGGGVDGDGDSTMNGDYNNKESNTGIHNDGVNKTIKNSNNHAQAPRPAYDPPLSWFHAFQGIKTLVASSWHYLRLSTTVHTVIESQPGFQLDLNPLGPDSFFGHLLDGLQDELAAEATPATGQATSQAYSHAICVLNWGHRNPHPAASLAFPATVARRFIELLEARRPRAMAILACFFALLKRMDDVWWLHDTARREVMGVAGTFGSGSRWWQHLEWAVRIAMWEGKVQEIPPSIWGADWNAAPTQNSKEFYGGSMMSHIEVVAGMLSQPREEMARTPSGLEDLFLTPPSPD